MFLLGLINHLTNNLLKVVKRSDLSNQWHQSSLDVRSFVGDDNSHFKPEAHLLFSEQSIVSDEVLYLLWVQLELLDEPINVHRDKVLEL